MKKIVEQIVWFCVDSMLVTHNKTESISTLERILTAGNSGTELFRMAFDDDREW